VPQQLLDRLQVIIRQQQVTLRRRIAASRSRYSCSQEAPRPGTEDLVAWVPGTPVSGSGAAGRLWCWLHAGRGDPCRGAGGALACGTGLGVWAATGGTRAPGRSAVSPSPPRTAGWQLRSVGAWAVGAAAGEGCLAPPAEADWNSSPTAAEAWLRWATDWFFEVSFARKGPWLAGAPTEWPYLWQKSK
jgi:hypothetical protein